MILKFFFAFFLSICLVSCDSKLPDSNLILPNNEIDSDSSSKLEKSMSKDTLVSAKLQPKDTILEGNKIPSDFLVDIQTLDNSILVDLKYASNDNFMKKKLYFTIDKLYLQKDVAKRLVQVQHYLKSIRPDLSLLVYDGVRPLSVQKAMWIALDTIPVRERTKFVSNPASGSIHNYGAAVDLTLATNDGKPLDMGAGYDDIRKIAYPSMEDYFLKTGELTIEQVSNRKLLRYVMKTQGFTNINTEWWHFNACNRVEAEKKYQILE
jgi:D-alanyl-D-alanine dipeptidase